MSLISRLYDFVSQTRIRSVEVDNEFNQLVNSHNLHDDRIDLLEEKDTLLQIDIDLANASADSAVATANTANATANLANGKADSAVSTANLANGKADGAVNTANTANANATTALNKATQVETDYNAIVPVINQAVTDAEQAVADVASKADVSYVDQVASNFAMGVITDGSLLRQKLAPAVIDELDGLRADVDNTTNDIVLIKSGMDDIDNSITFLVEQVNEVIDALTLIHTGWVASGDAIYPYKIETTGGYFLDTMTPIVTFTRDCIENATESGVIVECTDGFRTFLAKSVPTIDLHYSIVYVKGVYL